MNLKIFAGLPAAALMLLFSALLIAQTQDPDQIGQAAAPVVSVPELRREANRAFVAKDYPAFRAAMEQLHHERPNNSDYMYQLVLAHALLDEKSAAYNLMLKMQRQGLSYDFDQAPESANLRGTQIYAYLNDLMVSAGEPLGVAEAVVTLDESIALPEAIAWDPERGKFLVGTVADGQILAVGRDGETSELLRADNENGVWGIYGLAVDSKRNRLWASSAARPEFSGYDVIDKGRSVLIEFRLDTLELIRRIPVPVDGQPHTLGSLAVSPAGDVYVTDSLLPLVYRKPADTDRLQLYFVSPELVNLRDLELSADGELLYLADYEVGVVVIDIEEGQPYSLARSEMLNLGGIDSIRFWRNHLVIVQGGIRPKRVMRLELDETGRTVSGVAPLAVALEIMESPNQGTVVGDDLYYFANSHWRQRNADRKPVIIARTPLAEATNIIDPEAQQLMERINEARERGEVRPGKLPEKDG